MQAAVPMRAASSLWLRAPSSRRTWLRLPEHWPWTGDPLDAYQRRATIT
jgi:hypothetical protein